MFVRMHIPDFVSCRGVYMPERRALSCLIIPLAVAIAATLGMPAQAQISNGHCRCKDLCDQGSAMYSAGHSVAECKRLCAAAFSGCTAGERRSNVNRLQRGNR